MSERVKRLLPILKRINKLGDKAKRQYVKKCNKKFVDCVSECAKNIARQRSADVEPDDETQT